MRLHPAALSTIAVLATGLALGCVDPNPFYESDPLLGPQPRIGWELTADLGLSHVPVTASAADTSPPVAPPPDAAEPGPSPADGAADDLHPDEGKLCDACDPGQPSCSEPGGLCLIVNDAESFCTRPCARKGTCPDGYECVKVQVINGSATPDQCVPVSRSCH